ncbi:MAG: HAD family hydrolase [Candidatus Promineifilaceae bacterium]
MGVKAILFDYGQVLTAASAHERFWQAQAELAAALDMRPEALWPYLFESEAARRWFTGQIGPAEFWRLTLEPHGILDPAERAAFAERVFEDTNEINPDMAELLLRLRGRYKLAVVSNASWSEAELAERIYAGGALPGGLFDAIVTSTSAGAVKPEPEIFQLALDRLGVRPQEAVFCDDLATFANAAQRLGMQAHHFTTPAACVEFLRREGVQV